MLYFQSKNQKIKIIFKSSASTLHKENLSPECKGGEGDSAATSRRGNKQNNASVFLVNKNNIVIYLIYARILFINRVIV